VLAGLAIIIVLAKLAGAAASRLRMPEVTGELAVGIVLGNLGLLGWHHLDFIASDPGLALLAELGVILLLFEIGLETSVAQLRQVGGIALAAATVGVIVPMGLGYGVAAGLQPGLGWQTHLFVAAILAATSVGVTARVLKDLGHLASVEGRIILAAAVIDDVLGLLVLAVVKGVVVDGGGGGAILIVVVKALGFLAVAVLAGPPLAARAFAWFARIKMPGVELGLAVALCFALSLAADAVGLAPIVGAFAAGLVLDHVEVKVPSGRLVPLETLIHPLTAILVPVFFVITGAHVDLAVLARPASLVFGFGLALAAILGKQACAVVVPRRLNRLAVGIGMIPRGEVGLIFAAVGAATLLPDGHPVVDPPTYAAAVIMIFITTLITPPFLAAVIARRGMHAA
jgi:Kef-type K+ transport system membrane component KefB